MDLDIFFSQNKSSENSFFPIKDSTVFIETNDQKANLNLEQITNV